MNTFDVRSQQRFQHFSQAFSQLEKAMMQSEYNDLEKQGLIQSFECVFELAWKFLQDRLREVWYAEIPGPKSVIRQAFQDGLIDTGDVWIDMLESRNLSTHTYNQDMADDLARSIKHVYFPLFHLLYERYKT